MEFARAPPMEREPTPQSFYEYTVTYIPIESSRRFHFSSKEIRHLTIAALFVLGVGFSLGFSPKAYTSLGGPFMLFIFAFTVTASFLAHELAHKFVAQKAGLWAEFRLMLMGLVLTALSIISPIFKIISPGAVLIFGFTEKKNVGKISIAGPSVNLALSIMLAGLFFAVKQPMLMYTSAINAWIALFNLIPFGILDGYKVFRWNKIAWSLAFMASLALTILTYTRVPF